MSKERQKNPQRQNIYGCIDEANEDVYETRYVDHAIVKLLIVCHGHACSMLCDGESDTCRRPF